MKKQKDHVAKLKRKGDKVTVVERGTRIDYEHLGRSKAGSSIRVRKTKVTP